MPVLIGDLLALHARTGVPRAWPRPDGTITVELRDDHGRLRAGTLTTTGLDLLPYGEDRRLPGLTALLAAGGDLVVHRAGRRAVVRLDGRFVKLVRPSRTPAVARAAHDAAHRVLGTGIDIPALLATGPDRIELASLPGTVPAPSDAAAWEAFGARWPALAATSGDAGAQTRGRTRGHAAGEVPARDVPASDGHAGDVPAGDGLVRHDGAREAETLVTWIGHAHRHAALPADLQHGLEAAAAELGRELCDGTADPAVFLHRDLHPRQLLWDADRRRLGVLDADTAARGEAALDLGNLVAHLDHTRALAPATNADTVASSDADTDTNAVASSDTGIGTNVDTNTADHAARAGVATAADRLAVSGGRLALYTRAAALRLVCVHAFRPAHRDATLRWARTLLLSP